MSGPHVHAELIKAWADGDEIQVYIDYEWQDNAQPSWSDKLQYRIKRQKIFQESIKQWVRQFCVDMQTNITI